MLPYIIIGVFAFLGLLGWGVWGAMIGAGGGYFITLLLGSLSEWIQGGILPRKVRTGFAARFLLENPDVVARAFPSVSPAEVQSVIECAIEDICKRAASDNKAMNVKTAWTRSATLSAGYALAEEEEGPEKKVFLLELTEYLAQ
jgi:hypothetical protein